MQEIYEAIHFDRVFKAVRKREKFPSGGEYYSDGKKISDTLCWADSGYKKVWRYIVKEKKKKKKYV